MPVEKVKYICKEKSLIGNELHEAGAEVMYEGLPAENLIPTCDEGRKRHQEYLDSNAARVRAMQSQFTESAVGDPSKFMTEFAKAQAEMMAGLPALIGTAVAEGIAQAMAAARTEYAQPAAAPTETPPAAATGKGKGDKDKSGESLV